MANEPVKIIQRRFVNRMLESGLLILAVALGVGAAASGLSLLLHTNQYSKDMLSSTSYRELVITTKDKSEDMETALVEKSTGDEVILTSKDLNAAEIIPYISYAYIANRSQIRFISQQMINRVSQGDSPAGGPEGGPPPGGDQGDDNRDNRVAEMEKTMEEAVTNPDVIIPEIEELSGFTITPQYFEARNLSAEYGSLFTEKDMTSSTDYIVLGKNIAQLLSIEGSDPSTLIGKKILSFNSYYTIIGILEEKGTSADDAFFRPDSGNSRGGFGPNNSNANRQLRFTVTDPSDLDKTAELLKNWFEKSYGAGEFVISNPRAEAQRLMSRNKGISLLILFLSLAGLFIASVNISNILMSRTLRMKKHVGILKALGASNKNVFKLFAGEALVITIIGAVLGSVIAIPLSKAMESAMGLDQSSWFFIAIGVLLSSILTFTFSVIPSFQNSGYEAAEAMRNGG